MGGAVAHHHAPYLHLGVALLPAGQPLGEQLLGLRAQRHPLFVGERVDRGVTPGVHRHQWHRAPGRLVESHRHRGLRRRRPVDAHDDRGLLGLHRRIGLLVNHRHRAVCVVDEAGADRAQQSPAHPAEPTVADHEQLSVLGQVDHRLRGVAFLHVFADRDRTFVGDRLLGDQRCLAQDFAGPALRDLVQFTGYRHLVPGEGLRGGQDVGQRQRYPVQDRFPCGPFNGRLGLRRTVHPDQDSSM